MYIKDPSMIEVKSFEIIAEAMGPHGFDEAELPVVKRMIHTTGDFDYKNIAAFKNEPIKKAIDVLKAGCHIFTDTRMAYSGINKRALEKLNCTIDCFIDIPEVHKLSKEKEITRSMASIDIAAEKGIDVFVIGNAPTALFRLGELIESGKAKPKLVIGVPVGFVGAAESKEYIRGFDIPTITTEGTKGGSNVAACIVNALLYMVVER